MKKAILVPFTEKKDAQVMEDIALGPRGRFFKMFDLISLSILFSADKNLKMFDRQDVIVLKKKAYS
ncbi:MAG: hypothetical protein ACKO1F_15560 [Flammeovirgaceae bacterium]|jgi:hypothetical protein